MTTQKKQKEHSGRTPFIASLIIFVAAAICYWTIPSVQEFFDQTWEVLTSDDKQRMQEYIRQLGWSGPLVLVLLMTVQMFLIVVPSVFIMAAAVIAYGPLGGGLLAMTAIFVASSVGYWIGRSFSSDFTEKLIGTKQARKLEGFIEDYGFWAVTVFRINPFLSNDAISFVAGILNMNYWRFIGATMLGTAPLTIFIAIMGKTTERMQSGLLWGSLISLALLLGYIYWDKRLRNSSE